jgi:hypothetical protein
MPRISFTFEISRPKLTRFVAEKLGLKTLELRGEDAAPAIVAFLIDRKISEEDAGRFVKTVSLDTHRYPWGQVLTAIIEGEGEAFLKACAALNDLIISN